MKKVRGTSSAPTVLGLIGGILGLPAALCSGSCAAGITSIGAENAGMVSEIGNFYLTTGLIGAAIALIFACLTKKYPRVSGTMLLIATAMQCVTLVTFNIMSLIVVILLLVAAVLSFTQKKELIEKD